VFPASLFPPRIQKHPADSSVGQRSGSAEDALDAAGNDVGGGKLSLTRSGGLLNRFSLRKSAPKALSRRTFLQAPGSRGDGPGDSNLGALSGIAWQPGGGYIDKRQHPSRHGQGERGQESVAGVPRSRIRAVLEAVTGPFNPALEEKARCGRGKIGFDPPCGGWQKTNDEEHLVSLGVDAVSGPPKTRTPGRLGPRGGGRSRSHKARGARAHARYPPGATFASEPPIT